ncbi:MAG: 5-(carboxyamino)imidazole ribonucleotide mutase [Candidatus Omnitrophica bacterium]|nr:5-(carboxyamino)imidazole ribonucleotide mutase [Candidatus Omnitrophota bacterium]
MSRVAIIMGSKSDMPTIQYCLDTLDEFGIKYVVKVLSAHRTPKETAKFTKGAQKNGIKIIIAAAGMAAHLAGAVAANTTLPVIGIPIESKSLAGIDALFSTVQMPGGIPVACMAIGTAGAKNAAVLAVQILSLSDRKLQNRLSAYKKKLARKVLKP